MTPSTIHRPQSNHPLRLLQKPLTHSSTYRRSSGAEIRAGGIVVRVAIGRLAKGRWRGRVRLWPGVFSLARASHVKRRRVYRRDTERLIMRVADGKCMYVERPDRVACGEARALSI